MDEPEGGAAAGGRQEESSSADHGGDTKSAAVFFCEWREVGCLRLLSGGSEGWRVWVSSVQEPLFIGPLRLLLTSATQIFMEGFDTGDTAEHLLYLGGRNLTG